METKVKYTAVPTMLIFTTEEIEGVVGLAGSFEMGMAMIAEDGSVTIQEMS